MQCVDSDGISVTKDNLQFSGQKREDAQSVPGKPEITVLTHVGSTDYTKMVDMTTAWNLPGDADWSLTSCSLQKVGCSQSYTGSNIKTVGT